MKALRVSSIGIFLVVGLLLTFLLTPRFFSVAHGADDLPNCTFLPQGQDTPPTIPPFLILQGTITENGVPTASGTNVDAHVNGVCVGGSTEVGVINGVLTGSNGVYQIEIVAPLYPGGNVTFHYDDGRVAQNSERLVNNQNSNFWVGPIFREVNLQFVGDPPTANQIFRGSAFAFNYPQGVPDGVEIYAQVGNYRTEFSTITQGGFVISVDAPEVLEGSPVEFYLRGYETLGNNSGGGVIFDADGSFEDVNLFFNEAIDAPTEPEPTTPTDPTTGGGTGGNGGDNGGGTGGGNGGGGTQTSGGCSISSPNAHVSTTAALINMGLFTFPAGALTAVFIALRLKRRKNNPVEQD